MDAQPLTTEFLLSFTQSHYSSLVSNLRIKYKNKTPVWIDIHKISLQELRDLDPDEEINHLIQEASSMRYRDRDY